MYTGKQTIDWLFHEQLKVDEEWSVRTENGFRWWADRNAQTIEVVGETPGLNGNTGYFVSVRTELLRELDLDERAATTINSLLMPFASMAGPVYDRETKTLSLCLLVRVHEVIAPWMNPIISVAALLQIDEARRLGTEWAELCNAKEAVSGHLDHGIRPEPDELVSTVEDVIVPLGSQPSPCESGDFEDVVDQYMRQPPALEANAGGLGFTVEFPYGGMSSLCQVNADQRHPRYGNGLQIVQSFPLGDLSERDGITLALWYNELDLTQRPLGYGFGSYCYRNGLISFNSFWPNVTYQPGLLANIYFTCAERAREISVRLTDTDWTPESFKRSRSALRRLMDRFVGD